MVSPNLFHLIYFKLIQGNLKCWKEFFDKLYNHDPPQGPIAVPPTVNWPDPPMNLEPTIEEVKLAVD